MDDLRLVLPGSIRSKKNSKRIFSRGRFKTVLPSKAYCTWEKIAREAILEQLESGFQPLSNLLHVVVTAYYKGQQPDLSGVLESVGDCIEGFVWENDKQIMSWDGSRLFHDLSDPHTEVTVKNFEHN